MFFHKYNHFPQRKFTGNWTRTLEGVNAKESFDDGEFKPIDLKLTFNKQIYMPEEILEVRIDIKR